MSKNHIVNVAFTFTGKVEVKGAESRAQALEIVKRDFGLCVGTPNTSNDENIVNWDVQTHANKKQYK